MSLTGDLCGPKWDTLSKKWPLLPMQTGNYEVVGMYSMGHIKAINKAV